MQSHCIEGLRMRFTRREDAEPAEGRRAWMNRPRMSFHPIVDKQRPRIGSRVGLNGHTDQTIP